MNGPSSFDVIRGAPRPRSVPGASTAGSGRRSATSRRGICRSGPTWHPADDQQAPRRRYARTAEDEASSRLRANRQTARKPMPISRPCGRAAISPRRQPTLDALARSSKWWRIDSAICLASGRASSAVGQHDHQPHRPAAGVLGRADDVVVGRGVQLLFVKRRGVERIVQSRDAIETQLDCDRFDLVRDGIRCHGFASIVGDGTKRCPPATSTR